MTASWYPESLAATLVPARTILRTHSHRRFRLRAEESLAERERGPWLSHINRQGNSVLLAQFRSGPVTKKPEGPLSLSSHDQLRSMRATTFSSSGLTTAILSSATK